MKLTKLFTVVALATAAPIAAADTAKPRTLPSGAPACGNVQIKGQRMRRCNTTTATAPKPVKPEPVKPTPSTTGARKAPQAVLEKLLSLSGFFGNAPARPRTLNNGAPACGNVGSRAVQPCEVEKPVSNNN